jgi:5'-deoxynucleotidase YfbR-like HD superfamily hydrolase
VDFSTLGSFPEWQNINSANRKGSIRAGKIPRKSAKGHSFKKSGQNGKIY